VPPVRALERGPAPQAGSPPVSAAFWIGDGSSRPGAREPAFDEWERHPSDPLYRCGPELGWDDDEIDRPITVGYTVADLRAMGFGRRQADTVWQYLRQKSGGQCWLWPHEFYEAIRELDRSPEGDRCFPWKEQRPRSFPAPPIRRHQYVRPRERRTAARRAAGVRSGQDPGDEDGEDEPAGGRLDLALPGNRRTQRGEEEQAPRVGFPGRALVYLAARGLESLILPTRRSARRSVRSPTFPGRSSATAFERAIPRRPGHATSECRTWEHAGTRHSDLRQVSHALAAALEEWLP